MTNVQDERKVVGFFRQSVILFWKNGLLFRRNISGTIAEIFVALLFLLILVFMRFFVDSNKYEDQNSTTNPLRYLMTTINVTSNRNLIMYYPNNAYIQGIVENAYQMIKLIVPAFNATVNASAYSDASKLDGSVVSNLFALVSFPDTYTSLASLPNQVVYTLYTQERAPFQYNIEANFRNLSDYMYTNSPEYYCRTTNFFRLYATVFNPIKHAVDLALITSISGVNMSDPTLVRAAQFNCPSYNDDIFKTRFSFFAVLLITIAYLFTLVVNLGNIIVEKQTKMKEYLKLVGIKWYTIWITWFLRSFLLYMVITLILSGILKAKLKPRLSGNEYGEKAFLMTTEWFVGFSLFFIYSIQTSMFTLLLGQIFSQTFVAKIVTIIIWILTAIEFNATMATGAKYFLCMFPNCAIVYAFEVIFQFERSGKTLAFSNLYTNLYGDPLNLGGIMGMMILWTLIYIPIAWYIERIFPGEYGAPLPFYFPFMPSYWKGPKRDSVEDAEMNDIKLNDSHGFEKEPNGLDACISIRHITKRFRIGFKEKTVVDDLSLDIYENQITGLLGHNGAGKTTTTFMLCGIYAPDKGNAYILGNNIITQMDRIRSSLGFCPQYDILFDDLTVEEHLDLIASIKGYSKKEIKEEILSISKLVGLNNDLKKRSKQLSGGMKRRLSVAMALTGGSKVIILDEPTSGLDPYNRRGLWELIRKFKQGRSIILTTHFMEEADALSDRIAIMNHGQVRCCGSPLFLKNTFGSGYRLTLAKNKSFDEPAFKSILAQTVEKYSIETNIAAEFSLAVPFGMSSKLPQLLTTLEQNKTNLGVDGYGISSPTIEEVFIKVGSIDNNKDDKAEEFLENKQDLSSSFSNEIKRNSGFTLWFQQLISLLMKKFWIFIRRWILGLIILLLPFLLQAILASIIPSQTNLINSIRGIVSSVGSYELDVTKYGKQDIPYYIGGGGSTASLETLVQNVLSAKSSVNPVKYPSNNINDQILQDRKNSLQNIMNNNFVGLIFNMTSSNRLYADILYSQIAYHSSANVLNDIDNFLLYYARNYDTSKSIKTYNSPIASNASLAGGSSFLEVLACIDSLPVSLLNLIVSFIIAFMIGIMVMHVAKERLNGSKQLQLLSGVHFSTYWISHYLFDTLIYIFNILTIIFALAIVNLSKNDQTNEIYTIAGTNNLGYFLLLLLFSCFSWSLLAYVWSFKFKSDIIGFVTLTGFLGFLAFIDPILTFVELLIINGGSASGGSRAIRGIRYLLIFLFPNLTVKRGLYNMKIRTNNYCIDSVNKYLATGYVYSEEAVSINEPGIGLLLLFSVLQFFIYLVILIFIELKIDWKSWFSRCRKTKSSVGTDNVNKNIEPDVQAEIDRVRRSDLKELAAKEPLVVSDLVRKFRKNKVEFTAVNNLGFGIAQNESFGLLGLNGAGKTTTFKILTGEIKPTSGNAFINGYNIKTEKYQALRNLGFCPQFDILPEYLTVKDTFKLIAGLRGLEKGSIDKTVTELIQVFKLDEFNEKLVQNLSGGNKRKVSSGIAFIGRPSVVILDEPTTGMDPAARRYLWTVIKKARDLGMTIVLTTHSMEESEALSSRLGIMVNGQFKCLGSVQHLKNKYGKGYSLILKCKNQSESMDEVKEVENFVQKNIIGAIQKDKQQETLFYQITTEGMSDQNARIQSIAELFSLLESNKESLKLETYSLSQTTLEQVFLSFAKEQKGVDDDN